MGLLGWKSELELIAIFSVFSTKKRELPGIKRVLGVYKKGNGTRERKKKLNQESFVSFVTYKRGSGISGVLGVYKKEGIATFSTR